MAHTYPSFNISKSTATTSTTNENTTSGITASSSRPGSGDEGVSALVTTTGGVVSGTGSGSGSGTNSPFLRSILTKTPPATETTTSPKFGLMDPVPVSSVSPTLATMGSGDSKKISSKSELIGLFDKFDINKKEPEQKEEVEVEKEKVPEDDLQVDQGLVVNHPTQLIEEKEENNEIEDKDTEKENENEKEEDVKEKDGEVQLKNSLDGNNEKVGKSQEISEKMEKDNHIVPETVDEAETELVEMLEKPQPLPMDTESARSKIDDALLNLTGDDVEGNDKEEENEDETLQDYNEVNDNSNDDEFALSPHSESTPTVAETQDEIVALKKLTLQVNSDEQHQQSHKPFDFQTFLLQLKKKSADPIVRYIRSFLVSFSKQAHTFSPKQKVKIIRDFKIFMYEKFTLYEPFASMDEIDLENSREGLEKLIMNRLHEYCFPPAIAKQLDDESKNRSIYKELKLDQKFITQVEKFSWVNGSHLDIDLNTLTKTSDKKSGLNFMEYAIVELNKINNYRAPRDKIICVLNLCKIIVSFLKVSKQETNADAFVPLLILVLIKAKTKHLVSNMHYIESYRAEEWVSHGETSYYISSLQGALGFVQELSFNDLTISEEEYDAHMEAWEAHEKQLERERAEASTSIVSSNSEVQKLHQPQPQHVHSGATSPRNGQQSMAPSSVLLNSAEMFGKSISNFLSPSPQPASTSPPLAVQEPAVPDSTHIQPQPQTEDTPVTRETFDTLVQMFPNLDKGILQDLVYIKKGNIDECVDTCLELVADT